MALVIEKDQTPPTGLIADRRLCLAADRSRVVEANDAAGAFLFATPGSIIPAADVKRYVLSMRDGVIVLPGAAEPEPPALNDASPAPDALPPADAAPATPPPAAQEPPKAEKPARKGR